MVITCDYIARFVFLVEFLGCFYVWHSLDTFVIIFGKSEFLGSVLVVEQECDICQLSGGYLCQSIS